jgi:osmoprotectant transport system ATP-binding protein
MFTLDLAAKRYDGRFALRPTSLVFQPGKTTVLIGPSGCGKSTILRLLSGLIRPDEGAVLFDGEPVTPKNVTALRHRTGYVIQDGGLFPHLTGRQNARLLARHLGRPGPQIESRLADLCRITRLDPSVLDRFPSEISGGQRQRVALIRALMLDPDALLLDEPLGALDPVVRFDLQTDLAGIFRSLKKTVVLVTHDLPEAVFFADELVVLKDGAVVRHGSPADVVADPGDPFVERFVRVQQAREGR